MFLTKSNLKISNFYIFNVGKQKRNREAYAEPTKHLIDSFFRKRKFFITFSSQQKKWNCLQKKKKKKKNPGKLHWVKHFIKKLSLNNAKVPLCVWVYYVHIFLRTTVAAIQPWNWKHLSSLGTMIDKERFVLHLYPLLMGGKNLWLLLAPRESSATIPSGPISGAILRPSGKEFIKEYQHFRPNVPWSLYFLCKRLQRLQWHLFGLFFATKCFIEISTLFRPNETHQQKKAIS